jgi:hypothetical protein
MRDSACLNQDASLGTTDAAAAMFNNPSPSTYQTRIKTLWKFVDRLGQPDEAHERSVPRIPVQHSPLSVSRLRDKSLANTLNPVLFFHTIP